MTTDADIQIVHDALRDWHGYVRQYRYGGLAEKLAGVRAALDALERVEGRLAGPERELEVLPLFEIEQRGEKCIES